jgi:protoporphyrinogen/coproporphyrinogen III oxidase
MTDTKHIVIVGGGISGLSAAFYARKELQARGVKAKITLIEKSGRLGGKLHTLRKDGFVIEKGADSFLARKLPIIELTRELGIEAELTAVNPKAKTFILHKGKLHRMPPGLVLGIPTKVMPFVKSNLISPLGKLRAGLDLVLPRREADSDESLGDFLQRRVGREVLENIAEPLLAGIYAGDTSVLSLQATFPQFHSIEKKSRSLILGMVASRKTNAKETSELPNIAKNSMFLTFKNGLSSLVERLIDVLQDVEVVTGCGVTKLEQAQSDGGAQEYRLTLDDGRVLTADRVILALPAPQTAALLPDLPEKQPFENMSYVSVANVVMAFRAEDVGTAASEGSGFVVPRREGRFITACTWTSTKWLHTAPEGKALLRMYVGRAGEQEWVSMTDEEIIDRVRRDIREIMGLTEAPLFTEVTRLMRSMPQYPVGHPDNVRRLLERVRTDLPGLQLCGSAYNGVGIPDCVRVAKGAAMAAVDGLSELS